MNVEEHKSDWLAYIKARDIEALVITYSGEGDSGSVNAVEFRRNGEDFTVNSLDPNDPHEIARRTARVLKGLGDELELEGALQSFAYDLLDHLSVGDWVNDDGGGGTITINAADNTIKVEHYQNKVTQPNSEYLL